MFQKMLFLKLVFRIPRSNQKHMKHIEFLKNVKITEPYPWVSHKGRYEFVQKVAEIFAAQGAPPLTLVANLRPVSLIPVVICHWWQICKGGRATVCFFKSANSWSQSTIADLQISEICKSTNFFWLICKLQICKFCWWANPQIANSQIIQHKKERIKHLFFIPSIYSKII